MDPVKVIKLSCALGARPVRILVVGCEPQIVVSGEDYNDMLMELSEPVRAAVEEAAKLVESLVEEVGREARRFSPDIQQSHFRGEEKGNHGG